MKSLIFFLLGAGLAIFLKHFLNISLWLELVIVLVVALVLWVISTKANVFREKNN